MKNSSTTHIIAPANSEASTIDRGNPPGGGQQREPQPHAEAIPRRDDRPVAKRHGFTLQKKQREQRLLREHNAAADSAVRTRRSRYSASIFIDYGLMVQFPAPTPSLPGCVAQPGEGNPSGVGRLSVLLS